MPRKFNELSQQELADLFDVDRTTIRNWQHAGMPYQKPERSGCKASYSALISLHWYAGNELAKKLSIDLIPVQKVLLSFMSAMEGKKVSDTDLQKVRVAFSYVGVTDSKTIFAAYGYANAILASLRQRLN